MQAEQRTSVENIIRECEGINSKYLYGRGVRRELKISGEEAGNYFSRFDRLYFEAAKTLKNKEEASKVVIVLGKATFAVAGVVKEGTDFGRLLGGGHGVHAVTRTQLVVNSLGAKQSRKKELR